MGLIGEATSVELRMKVLNHFHLGFANGKTMLKRLNLLGITADEVKSIL